MPRLSSKEILKRHVAMIDRERKNPPGWWYLSFAEPGNWLGAIIVQGQGFATALDRANRLGINPGGEVQGFPLSEDLSCSSAG